MPVIRCPKCGQAYDVPGVVAARLPNSIATCHCGEWIAGSKAAVLARMLDPAKIKEIDLQPYRIDSATAEARDAGVPPPSSATGAPRSVRIVALGADQALDTTFSISAHPLFIGRRGSHVLLPDPAIGSRQCSIIVRGDDLVLVHGASRTPTLLDGKPIAEAPISDGVHLVQLGTTRLAVEQSDEKGFPIEALPPLPPDENDLLQEIVTGESAPPIAAASPQPAPPPPPAPAPAMPPTAPAPAASTTRAILVCIEGPLNGQEFEVPPAGLIVGREGHVRVPDEFLSRRHFQVTPDTEGAIRVKDLGSRNGTFLNSAPAADTVVNPGDEIRAGVNAFRIEHRA